MKQETMTRFLQAVVDKEFPGRGITVQVTLENAPLVGSGEWVSVQPEAQEFDWKADLTDSFWQWISTL